ncbi:hypothetical protein ACVBIL_14730 [Shewanella sp. 125m-7]
MKTNLLSKSSDYFIGSFVMFLGLLYNLVEQDLFGSTAFLLSTVIFLLIGFIKYRASKRYSSAG